MRRKVKIRLIHPEFGLVAEQRIYGNYTKEGTISLWKNLYGRKFNECQVEMDVPENSPKDKRGEQRRVVNLKTGDVYESMKEASEKMGYSHQTLSNHAKRLPKGRFGYLVRYE